MKSLINSSYEALKNPEDYEARSNIMWTATWALNTLISRGKSTDWMVHMIGQAVGAYTDATHGMTLAAVTLPYYRMIMPYGIKKFRRFAEQVWQIDTNGMTDEEAAEAGLIALETWMNNLDLCLSTGELGVNEYMIDGIANATIILNGGYKVLSKDDVKQILRESL